MTLLAPTEDELRRDILRFLALNPDAKFETIVKGCQPHDLQLQLPPRRETSRTLDHLIAEDFVSIRRPVLVRFFGALMVGPLAAFFVGAERYTLTHRGLLWVAYDDSG